DADFGRGGAALGPDRARGGLRAHAGARRRLAASALRAGWLRALRGERLRLPRAAHADGDGAGSGAAAAEVGEGSTVEGAVLRSCASLYPRFSEGPCNRFYVRGHGGGGLVGEDSGSWTRREGPGVGLGGSCAKP